MTQFLPSGLLALFAPRDPIPFKPPLQTLTWEKDREKAPYTGVGHLVKLFEEPTETPPPTRGETKAEKKRRKIREREERRVVEIQDEVNTWDPHNDPNAGGDAFKTLFVSRISYDTSESKLKREFEKFGRIKKVTIVKNIVTGKPRGYAFIEYEKERDMHNAYKSADGNKIEGRRVLVDVERGRTVKGWKPRRLGGGLGSTRAHTDVVHTDGERDRDDKGSDRRGDSGRESSRRRSSERVSHRDRDRGDRDRGTRDRSDRDRSTRDRSDRDKSDRGKSDRDKSDHDKSDRDKSDRDKSDRDKSDRDKSDRDKSDRDKSDRDKSDRDRSDRDKRKRDERRDRDKKDDKDRSERRHRESRRDRDKDREHRRDRDKDRSNRDRRDKNKSDNPRSGDNTEMPSENREISKTEQSESYSNEQQEGMEEKMQINNDGSGDGINPNTTGGILAKSENNGYDDQMPANNENGVSNDYNPTGLKREFDNEENMQSETY